MSCLNCVHLLYFRITEKALQPLKLQLATLDEAIKEQLDIIATIKANVIHNDSRIEAMLHSVAKL